MTRLTIESLSKQFDGVSAVDHASIEVQPGELMVVLGPSGAGKTALARLIVGLDQADSGEIFLGGRSLIGVAPRDRKIGFVPEDDALWPHLSIADNVGYGLRLQGIGRKERRKRVAEALAAARIESLADRRPETLSPLQRRRAAVARALVVEPDLLLIDEPSARLDPRIRPEFRAEVRRLHAESRVTTLALTADAREALALGDRLAVLDFGKIPQVGTPSEVYNRPRDAFVAQILGPTNLIGGHADAVAAGSREEVVVKTPLGRLIGVCSDGAPEPGTPVTVSIRPEGLGIGPSVPPGSNRFAATVEGQSFSGATRSVSLRGPNDWPIVAMTLQGQSDSLREGQGVTVSVAPERVVILPGRAGRGA